MQTVNIESPDVVPLHGIVLPPEMWWACEFPERPFSEDSTAMDWRCYGCFRAGEAALASTGDHIGSPDLMAPTTYALSEGVDLAREYHANLPHRT